MAEKKTPWRNPNFKKSVFKNGLTLISERHPGFQGLSIGVWVRTGTRYEKREEAGISHFLEHMLFKGTDRRSALDIVREIEKLGGDFNAFTGREYTCFQILLLGRHLKFGADILCDILLNSTFDPVEIEQERKVILQEIAAAEESPEELAFDLFYEKVYGRRHGLGRPILGTGASVRRLKRRSLLSFFRKHYRPEQIVISVVGDVTHPTVKKQFRRLTRKNWTGRTPRRESRKELGYEKAPPVKEGLWCIPHDTEQVHVVWGVDAPKFNSRLRFASLLLNVYLGGGMSSVLFQKIREQNGLAYNVYTSVLPFLDSGLFTIYFATSANKLLQCLALMRETVLDVCVNKVSAELLDEVKTNVNGTILLGSDDVESKMGTNAKYEMFFGRYAHSQELCAEIDTVTPAQVRTVARKLFGSGRASLLILGPRPPKGVVPKIRREFSHLFSSSKPRSQ